MIEVYCKRLSRLILAENIENETTGNLQDEFVMNKYQVWLTWPICHFVKAAKS